MLQKSNIPAPLPISDNSSGLLKRQHVVRRKKFLKVIICTLVALFSMLATLVILLFISLMPVDRNSSETIEISVKSGSSVKEIGQQLKQFSLIRNSTAFELYVRLIGKTNSLKSGNYRFSRSESTMEIVKGLHDGIVETFEVTFFPGSTLVDHTDKDASSKRDVTTVLLNAGYDISEINDALDDVYNTETDVKLFAGRPENADLEGYIYSQTYKFNIGVSVHDIFQATFDEFYKKLEENGLILKYESKGLTLYQAITLASIIQKEATGAESQKQVAQVFFSRLDSGMLLGSDVTYQYICDKLGVPRSVDYDSPYNTRKYPGLTPGPISNPNLSALIAVAEPADGDYLFFLAGDDGVIYFANTLYEHEQNIINHCQIGCSVQ